MYSYIKGVYQGIDEDKIIIEAGGVGYEVSAPNSVLAAMPEKGEIIKLYVSLIVREDAHEFVGFIDKEQKKIYQRLISVSGIGPKAAIAILSVLSPREIVKAVAENDYRAIARANGVGPKIAQKVVLELKGKVDKTALDEMSAAETTVNDDPIYTEALQALIALGFASNEAKQALKDTNGKTSSELIRQALSKLGSRI
ncbi:MAG: Holliday junction branch migration protein RuvA [Clostridiales bacterium]|nr:Holliday junction branch migration protein RuvA [Clostridiales bacterium]